jgi:hypothetical protein
MGSYAGVDYNLTLCPLQSTSNKICCMGYYVRVDFNLTLCPLESQLQHMYHGQPYTVIRFVSTGAKFGICTVVGLNGILVKDKMR